eukprot:gene16665-25622_t
MSGMITAETLNHPEPHETFVLDIDSAEEKVSMKADPKLLNAATFTIAKEDHTLGNLLATQLLHDPKVLYAGYKVPHPLENHIELKIQTTTDYTPHEALQTAITDCIASTTMIGERFKESVESIKGGGGAIADGGYL